MAYTTTERFSFVSKGLDEDTFGVIHFSGEEGLSRCYRFEIFLVTDQADLDLGRILKTRSPSPSTARTATSPFMASRPRLN